MLILLSASKKKIGSFITPVESISTQVSFVDAASFKYGFYGSSIFASGAKIDGFIPGYHLSSTLTSFYSADAFKYSSVLESSSYVSYRDASFLYGPSTAESRPTVSMGFNGGNLIFPRDNVTVKLGFVKIMLVNTGTNAQPTAFGMSTAQSNNFYNSYYSTPTAFSMSTGSSQQYLIGSTRDDANVYKSMFAFAGETI